MTFSERVLAQTRQFLLPKVVYNVLGSNVLAARLVGNGKKGKGVAIEKAIKKSLSGNASSFSGLDTFQAAQLDTKIRLTYDMRAIRQPVGVAGLEIMANQDAEVQSTDLVKEALEETQDELFDALGDYLYGTGLGNSGKDPVGLGAIVDDGTDVTTIGGQSRSTYSVLNATRTSLSGVALTLARMATLYSAISSGTGQSTPTMMISNETVWDLYESLLTPIVREQYSMMGYYQVGSTGGAVRGGSHEGLSGTQGFVALTYKGIPYARDEKATAQAMFMLNENFIQWYGWPASGETTRTTGYEPISMSHSQVETTFSEPPMSSFTGFNWSGFKTPTNQFGAIADILLVGNLTSWRPNRNGKFVAVTTV